MTAFETKVRRAEVIVAATMVKHNVPLAFAEHLSPLFREIFPDSEIANAYVWFWKDKDHLHSEWST